MAQEHTCHICGATFENKAQVEDHTRTVHAEYTCEVCGQVFTTKSDLETHNTNVHPEGVGVHTR